MKKHYCCDSNADDYARYYCTQAGGGDMPVFRGGQYQKGHGIGSVLSGLFKKAVPFLKQGASFLGKHALNAGLNIARDMADGSSFKDAAGSRLKQGLREGIKDLADRVQPQSESEVQEGGTRRKRSPSEKKGPSKKTKKSAKKKITGKKIIRRDIFS